MLVGLYAALQFYGLDPFGVFQGVGGVISSLGNPIFAGAFLLMVVPVTLALGLKPHGSTTYPVRTIFSIAGLTVLLLGMAFTQSRGPWVGLAAALVVFLVAVSVAMGWRSSLRALLMLVTAVAITWGDRDLHPGSNRQGGFNFSYSFGGERGGCQPVPRVFKR